MPQSLACLHHHIVFSTKNRQPLLTPDWQPRLHEYLGGILRAHGGCLLAAGGIPDHIHLLASISKQQSISDALRVLKANSSGWIHDTIEGQRNFAWQAGYGAFAVSYSNLDQIKACIAKQVEQHQQVSFKDEFLSLLKRHQLAYDEKYLWD